MKKIPTLFLRDETTHLATWQINPECRWVTEGEGEATQKIDGTCCMIDIDGIYWKRYELKKDKQPPSGFVPANAIDPNTFKQPGWVKVTDGPENKYHNEAYDNLVRFVAPLKPRSGTYELIGPKVQGDPEKAGMHVLVLHEDLNQKAFLLECPRTFDELKVWLTKFDIEGIVWHHEDGRMAKIKKRDFGLNRKPY